MNGQKETLRYITEVLSMLGVPEHMRGYRCLRDLLCIAVENRDFLGKSCSLLYKRVGDMERVSEESAQRIVAHAVNVAWKRTGSEAFTEILGVPCTCEPTGQMLAKLIADNFSKLKLHT